MQPHQVKLSYFLLLIFILLNLTTQLQNDDEHVERTTILKPKVDRGSDTKLDESCLALGEVECSKLRHPCLTCNYNMSCVYGAELNVTCNAVPNVPCKGNIGFERSMICQYCYQTSHWQHKCVLKGNCNSVSSPISYYRTNCTVNNDVLCLGRRTFLKNVRCNWTGGYRWSKAFLLSITLGGFGADRFYLGHWQDGVGKLFSFGGLGVWTLIDVILISIHYLGPADGSLYV